MVLNAADKKFLKAMIPHHEAAVKMAAAVIKEGVNPRVDTMARAIRDGQTKEIETMKGWLEAAGEKADGSMKM